MNMLHKYVLVRIHVVNGEKYGDMFSSMHLSYLSIPSLSFENL